MEAYFQQAKNTEAERRACEIRLRAERKAGQLLAKMEKNKGAAAPTRSSRATTLKELGVTKDQSSRWQALAGVSEEDFETALAGEEKPSTNGISGIFVTGIVLIPVFPPRRLLRARPGAILPRGQWGWFMARIALCATCTLL